MVLHHASWSVCFPKAVFQRFFSKEVNKPDRSKLEETEKVQTQKNAKKFLEFFELC